MRYPASECNAFSKGYICFSEIFGSIYAKLCCKVKNNYAVPQNLFISLAKKY